MGQSTESYHFIGIGGIGMSGLARILLSQNISVSGSDLTSNYVTQSLIKSGADVKKGHSADHIHPAMKIVYSSDIKKDNPEYAAALQMNCRMLHRSDLLAMILKGKKSLAVTGTHGKTTTSALLASVLLESGSDPSFAIGGVLPKLGSNAEFGKGDFFAFEADESDGSFLKYSPFGAIITNIDNDHLNHFGTERALIDAFDQFAGQVVDPNHLFWCGDDAHLASLHLKGFSYGFGKECNWRASGFLQSGWKIVFDIEGGGRRYLGVEAALIGRHNALNALAVFALAITLGVPESVIRHALKTFSGVMRRSEKKGEMNGILFIDDYAHHPTEIETTLKAIRKAVPNRRLVAVFQPHRYSRTKDCLGMYGRIFDSADELFITDIYGAGEAPIENLSSDQIMRNVTEESTIPCRLISRADLAKTLAGFLRPHDIVITLGAGDITKASLEIMDALGRQAPKKLKVGLVRGGRSSEHEISMLSAGFIASSLDHHLYEVVNFGITKRGDWIMDQHIEEALCRFLKEPNKRLPELISKDVFEALMRCDVMFPVLHGPFGEDGTIQAFFEMLGIAYAGCDYRASAICMDKAETKKLAGLAGINVLPSVDFTRQQWENERGNILKEIAKTLKYPLFVKPVHLGSSIGVKKVNSEMHLEEAVCQAFEYDTKVLVENGVSGRELEFAVLGSDDPIVFHPGEVLTGGGVYDYQAKYAKDGMKTAPKADLTVEIAERGKAYALKAYQALGCSGMARVDFFLDNNETFWLNEINPIPGFTEISLYPQICSANGIKASELLDSLICLALQRKRRQDRLRIEAMV